MPSLQLDVIQRTSDGVVLGWEPAALPTTTTNTTKVEHKHDEVHHLPSSVESTLASLPYDNLYFLSCVDGAFDDH